MTQETVAQEPVNKEAFTSWLNHYITKAFFQGLKEKHQQHGQAIRQCIVSNDPHRAAIHEGYMQCVQDIFDIEGYEFVLEEEENTDES